MDIKERIKEKRKLRVNLTIDKTTYDRLETYKKMRGIKSLSPVVNEMLIDWLDENAGDQENG